jgi:hypothetical protein
MILGPTWPHAQWVDQVLSPRQSSHLMLSVPNTFITLMLAPETTCTLPFAFDSVYYQCT